MKSHTRNSLGHIVLTVQCTGTDRGNKQEDTERYKIQVALEQEMTYAGGASPGMAGVRCTHVNIKDQH